jgi:TolB-like protein
MRKERSKKVLITFLLSFVFFLSGPLSPMAYEKEVKDLSGFMADQIAASGKDTIAVVDFTDLQGNVTELGRFLAEEFSVALAGEGKEFEVVDRTHLKSILKEHKLSSTGIIDPQTARQLGKIAGVGALVTGTITPFGDSIRISVKVLDTETAKVIGATTGNIAKTEAVDELLEKGIQTATTSGSSSATMEPAPPGGGKGIEAEGFVFRPVECIRSGSKVICTISFMNNGNEERNLRVYGKATSKACYIYDNFGNQHPVSVKVGQKVSRISINPTFPSKLPINVSLIAEGVRSDATHATAALGIREFKEAVTIRNIPITK